MTRVTLGEGCTPLIASRRIARELGLTSLAFKLEGCNPSGSYKDRFIAAELTLLLERGARACLATSSGNTGASLAAYAARYELPCTIVVSDATPAGKLVQMAAHGARLIQVRGFTTDAAITARVMALLQNYAAARTAALVVSAYRYCPTGMAGVETLGHELAAAAPAHVFVPAGSGGLFIAVTRGLATTATRVHAVQPAGCSTFVASWQRGDEHIRTVESQTRVSGLSVPFDIDASLALGELRARGGAAWGIAVPDDAIFAAQAMMMEMEGIYAEPAGAAALAGLIAARHDGRIDKNEPIVCIVSGHGFKDPASAAAAAARHPAAQAGVDELEALLA
ncbi:MAG: pyridoxal-phosphate dependent enzyme [Bryobacterales bacterium]|nr:pyridoxal-phosphate dependent enzyme [Bryobacterales bacterium]